MAWILPETVDEALALLDNEDEWERYRGAEGLSVLAPLSDQVIARLIAALDDPERNVRVRATDTLVELGKADASVVTAIIAAQLHPSEMVRRWLVEAIARAALPESRAIEAILSACADSSAYVRYEAVNQLTRMKLEHPKLIDTLIRVLKLDESRAAQALAVQQNTEPKVLTALVAGLHRQRVAGACAEALEKLQIATPEIVHNLFESACNSVSNYMNVSNSRSALSTLSTQRFTVEFLRQKLRSHDIKESTTAAIILAKSGAIEPEIYRTMLASLPLLDDTGKEVVLQNLIPWAENAPDIASACAPMLQEPSNEVRLAAASLLVVRSDCRERAIAVALELLSNTNQWVSSLAVDVLRKLPQLNEKVQQGIFLVLANPLHTAMQARENMDAYHYDFSIRRPLLRLLAKQKDLIPEIIAIIDELSKENSIAGRELRERIKWAKGKKS